MEVKPLARETPESYTEWSRFAHGLNVAGHHGWSLGILKDMKKKGFTPDARYFALGMNAILELSKKNLHNGNVDEAMRSGRNGIAMFNSMRRHYQLHPKTSHLELAARLYELLGDAKGLTRLVTTYPRQCHLNDTIASCLASLQVSMKVLPKNIEHLGEFRQYVRRNIPGHATFRHLIAKGLSERLIGLGHVSAVLTQVEEGFEEGDPRTWSYRGGRRIQRCKALAVAIVQGLVDAGFLRAAHGIHNSLLADLQSPQSYRALFQGAAEAAAAARVVDEEEDPLDSGTSEEPQAPMSKRGLESLVIGLQEDMAQNGYVLRGPEVAYTVQVLRHVGGPNWQAKALNTLDRATLFGTPIPRSVLYDVLEGTLEGEQVDRAEHLVNQFILRGVFNPTQVLKIHDMFIRKCIDMHDTSRALSAIKRIESSLSTVFPRARQYVDVWNGLIPSTE